MGCALRLVWGLVRTAAFRCGARGGSRPESDVGGSPNQVRSGMSVHRSPHYLAAQQVVVSTEEAVPAVENDHLSVHFRTQLRPRAAVAKAAQHDEARFTAFKARRVASRRCRLAKNLIVVLAQGQQAVRGFRLKRRKSGVSLLACRRPCWVKPPSWIALLCRDDGIAERRRGRARGDEQAADNQQSAHRKLLVAATQGYRGQGSQTTLGSPSRRPVPGSPALKPVRWSDPLHRPLNLLNDLRLQPPHRSRGIVDL